MIINADDFGANSDTTAAIIRSFENGWCSSTTLMAVMPGTEEACVLAHENNLVNHIGLHLVLDDADQPLTNEIKKCPRFCDKHGRLSLRRKPSIFRLDTSEKSALAEEIRAQISRCRSLGIPLTHADSHHHVHTEWAIGTVMIRIVLEQKIPFLRLSRNFGSRISLSKRSYKAAYNWRLKRAGLARTQYFGSMTDYVQITERRDVNHGHHAFEVMVHPVHNEQQEVTDGENGMPMAQIFMDLKELDDVLSFSGHKYNPTHLA